MSQNEFQSIEIQLATALTCFWEEMVRPLILNDSLSELERHASEIFGGALLAVSSCHKVLAGLVSEQKKAFPDALLEVLPSMRDAYTKYVKLFYPTCIVVDIMCRLSIVCAPHSELDGVDMSPTSVSLMPMQVLSKYSLLLKDASKEGGAEDSIKRAAAGVDSLCKELEWTRRKASNADKISALNSTYGTIFNDEDTLIDEAYFLDSADSKARPRRILLCETRLVQIHFKDKEGLKFKSSSSVDLSSIQGVRSNPLLGCLDIELRERDKKFTLQLFSDDSLLISQWVLALSLAIDRATNPV